MKSFRICSPFLAAIFILVESDRPLFRGDYRYEKAFDSFYKLHQLAAKWSEARIRCEAEGAELMVPETLDEADAMPLLVASILSKYEGIFLGMHDWYSERSFVTINGDGTINSILNLLWDHMQPLHSGGRCVAMRRNGRMFLHSCSKTLPFICKVKAEKIVYNEECTTFHPKWSLGINGSCYITHIEPQTWSEAYSTCLSAGGHLAILNTRHEAEYIRGLFKMVEERRLPANDFAFLGFSDLFQRYHYLTVHGENIESVGYSDWDLKSQCSTINGSNFRCGGLKRSGLLAVADCDVPAMFFCEKVDKSSNISTKLLRKLPLHPHNHEIHKLKYRNKD